MKQTRVYTGSVSGKVVGEVSVVLADIDDADPHAAVLTMLREQYSDVELWTWDDRND